ncbi:MAG TPA: FtsX-like permease family protein, partial [Acetobacteraceae bacterium]|nr:FtsX-like permease family protein [Acetobacteraceae bacterium]
MRGLLVVLLCLALGVAVIAAVGTLRSAVDAGLAASGREILGGDLAIEAGSQPLPDSLRDWLRPRGARVSDITEMRSILVAPSGERQLISLKAVDRAWPLVGAAGIAPPQPIAAALGRPPDASDGPYGLLAEPVVLERLGLHVGDVVRLGSATFRVAGALTGEPDKVATATLLAPHVLISAAALPSTRLISPGSIVRHTLRLTLREPAAAPRVANEIRAAFPDEGWRIRDPHDAAPGVGRFIDQTSLFLSLAGLTSLLVGGIGVANGVGAWLEARAGSIAILRCLGASSRLVFAVCLIQVMMLAGVGIAIGLVAGTALPLLAVELLRSVLPVPPVLGVYAEPLLLSGAFGVLTALCFALWPLGRAARLPGGALFRDALLPQPIWPSRTLLVVNVAVGVVLVFLTIAGAPDRRFAAYFCLAALGTLALFRASGWLMTRLARAVSRAAVRHAVPPWAKLGIASLHRPGSPAPLMLLSIGIGLTTLSAVALIEGNIRGEVLHQLPANAPSFFFVDIQSDQLQQFEKLVRAEPGVTELRDVPSLRARVVAVNGVPAE